MAFFAILQVFIALTSGVNVIEKCKIVKLFYVHFTAMLNEYFSPCFRTFLHKNVFFSVKSYFVQFYRFLFYQNKEKNIVKNYKTLTPESEFTKSRICVVVFQMLIFQFSDLSVFASITSRDFSVGNLVPEKLDLVPGRNFNF